MIRINLLGKKQAAAGSIPFGLDEKFAQLGITPSDLQELRPGLIRLAIIIVGLYLAEAIPVGMHERKVQELDGKLNVLTEQAKKLSQELATKRDIRKQMEQLNREEAELQRQLNAIGALQKNRNMAFRTLDSMVVSLPKNVWLTSFEYKSQTISLRGSCWEYFPINDLVKVINDSTQYSSVKFGGITTEAPEGGFMPGIPEAVQKKKNFSLEFQVLDAGGA